MPRGHNSFLTASVAVAVLALLAASAVLAAPATEDEEAVLAAPATEDEEAVLAAANVEPSEVGLDVKTTDSDGKENETSCIEFFGRRNCNRRQVLLPTAAGQGREGETAHNNNTTKGASHAGLDEFSNQMTQIRLAGQLPLPQQQRQFIEVLEAACQDSATLRVSFLRYAYRLYKLGATLDQALLQHGAAAPPTPAPALTAQLAPVALAYKKYNESLGDACRDVEHVKNLGNDGLLGQVRQLSNDAVTLLQFFPAYRRSVPPATTPRPKSEAELAAEKAALEQVAKDRAALEQVAKDRAALEQVEKDRAALEQVAEDRATGAAQAPTPTADVAAAQAAELAQLRQELAQLRRREERLNETTKAIKAVAEQDLGAAIVGLKAAAEKIAKALAAVGQHDGAAAAPSTTTTAAPATTPKTAEEKAADLRKLEQQLAEVCDREETLNEIIEQFADAGRDIDSVQLYVQLRKEAVKERAALEEAIAVLQQAPTTTPRPTPAPRRKTAAEKAAELVELQRRLAEVRRGEQEARDTMKYYEDLGSFDHLGGYVRTGLRLAEERAGLELAIANLQFSAADEQPQQDAATLREAVQSVKAVAEQDLGGAILSLQATAEKIAKALAAMGQPQPSR